MLFTLRKLFVLLAAMLSEYCAVGRGVEIHNSVERISGYWGSAASSVIIGPDAHIVVDGDWFISAANVYIHPDARVVGAGVIHLMSPAAYGAVARATTLDAGGILMGCRLSLENSATVTLAYLDPAALYPDIGFSDNHPSGSDNLIMATSLNFGSANAHLVLNASDLIFTSDTAATFRYEDYNKVGYAIDPAPPENAYQAYVVSAGATGGVITKLGLAAKDSFNYPLGQSGPLAGPYDYTPVRITNSDAVPHNYSVRVSSYANSAPGEMANRGIDRTWQITAEDSAPALVRLTHNTATGANIGTSGVFFNPAAAYIAQYDAAQSWPVRQATANGGSPVNVLSGSFTIPHSGERSFFTKYSDIVSPPPVRLLTFNAEKTADGAASRLTWESIREQEGDSYEVLRSTDGRNFFTSIARITGKGPAGITVHYTAYDQQPVVGDNFYCVRLTDALGHSQLSNIRKLRFYTSDFDRAMVAPNPLVVGSKLIIRVRESQQVLYSIITVTGSVVLSGSINAAAGEQSYDIYNLDHLAAAAYILKLQGATLEQSLKLIKE